MKGGHLPFGWAAALVAALTLVASPAWPTSPSLPEGGRIDGQLKREPDGRVRVVPGGTASSPAPAIPGGALSPQDIETLRRAAERAKTAGRADPAALSSAERDALGRAVAAYKASPAATEAMACEMLRARVGLDPQRCAAEIRGRVQRLGQ